MVNIFLASLIILIMYYILKFFINNSSDRYKIFQQYVSKTDILYKIIILLVAMLLNIIWFNILAHIFKANITKINSSKVDIKIDHYTNDFITITIVLFLAVSMICLHSLFKNICSVISMVVRYQTQKRNTIENNFLVSLYQGTDEEISRNYKLLKSTPYAIKSTPDEKMKLISALINQREFAEAEKFARFTVGRNQKRVKKKPVLKNLNKIVKH